MCAHEPSPNAVTSADPGLVTVRLTSLAPGSVAQVVSIQAGPDAAERDALQSVGVLPGTRLRVLSVSEGGEVEIQASRGVTFAAVPRPLRSWSCPATWPRSVTRWRVTVTDIAVDLEPAATALAQPRVVAAGGLGRRRSIRLIGLVVSTGLLAFVVLLSLAVGSKSIPFGEVVRAFTDFDGSNDHLVVRELRLPRTLVGLLVGAALAVSGALMQAITRNPLAEPGLLGVNAGAAFAVVFAICCSTSARSRPTCGSPSSGRRSPR